MMVHHQDEWVSKKCSSPFKDSFPIFLDSTCSCAGHIGLRPHRSCELSFGTKHTNHIIAFFCATFKKISNSCCCLLCGGHFSVTMGMENVFYVHDVPFSTISSFHYWKNMESIADARCCVSTFFQIFVGWYPLWIKVMLRKGPQEAEAKNILDSNVSSIKILHSELMLVAP